MSIARLSGTLTKYPVDVGVYDWAIGGGFFTPKRDDHRSPDYAAIKTPFSRQEYENKNHPPHGDDHGHGHDHDSHGAGEHDSHGTPAKNEHGHTSLQNLKRIGGLS